jgi:hypothetical protein
MSSLRQNLVIMEHVNHSAANVINPRGNIAASTQSKSELGTLSASQRTDSRECRAGWAGLNCRLPFWGAQTSSTAAGLSP